MLNFEHESLESNESFVFKQLIRVIRVIRVPKNNKKFACREISIRVMIHKYDTYGS